MSWKHYSILAALILVTYLVRNVTKGKTFAKVVRSDKYPNGEKYAVGYVEVMSSDENPNKLYPLPCP